MSRLKELIDELCPDGVEFKTIGEICDVITDFTAAGSFADIAKNVKYINNGTGYAQLIRTTDLKSQFQNTERFIFINEHAFNYLWRVNLNEESLILPNVGNCGEAYYATPEIFPSSNNALGPNAILVRSHSQNMRFLYHSFLARDFQKKLAKIVSPTGQTKFNKTDFKKLTIPVPPMEVQREIVRILDKFSDKNTELCELLSAELVARKKQYEYYRNKLLTFGADVPRVPLGEILAIKNGSDYKSFPEGNVPVYGSGGIIAHTSKSAFDKPTVLIPRKGSLDKLYYVSEPFWNVDTIFYTDINTDVAIPRYIYYCLQKEHLEKLNTAGGVPSLTQTVLYKVKIPLPPLSEQRRIADILDRFDALCNDLSSGIPAEIAARKKQYEYYRDRLLTFREKKF